MTDRTTGDDRRANFRVDDEVMIDYEVLDEGVAAVAERLAGEQDWPNAFSLCSRLYELHQESTVLRRHAQRESATFARLVDQLNRRLDLIAEVLLAREFEYREPLVTPADVGADGLGFRAPAPLAEGATLEVRLLFRSTGTGVRAAATVARCVRHGERDHEIGLAFHFTRERDRELMVHHVLTRQSMLLRDRQEDGAR